MVANLDLDVVAERLRLQSLMRRFANWADGSGNASSVALASLSLAFLNAVFLFVVQSTGF